MPPLTRRQLEITEGIAAGMNTAQIAQSLWLSEHTVKTHIRLARRNADNAPSRAALVEWARERGLVA